jgi:hypothetical protein
MTVASIGAHLLPASRPADPRGFQRSFQRQESVEDDGEAYGADLHAAAALRGFAVRSRDDEERDVKEEQGAETFSDDSTLKPTKKKRVYKKRKATHTIRKEEKQALEFEIQELQKELEMLKFRTMVENGGQGESERKRTAKSTVLREAVQEQHLVLARAQAMMDGQNQQSLYRLHPTEMTIRLGADRLERMSTLSALRGPKLQEAKRFLIERARGLSLTAPYFQEERYDTMDGDYCIARFDVTPFRGANAGVQQVFAALQQAVFNAEIIISESSGNITIREDDELGDDNLSHMRFVSQTPQGLQLETNLVLFSDCAQCQAANSCLAESGRYAIMASDFVDEDERFPYRPQERIRRDSTTVTMVTSYRDDTNGARGDGDVVVVVTRWALSIVRRPAMAIPDHLWDELRNSHVRWGDLMFNCVRQALGLPVVQ